MGIFIYIYIYYCNTRDGSFLFFFLMFYLGAMSKQKMG